MKVALTALNAKYIHSSLALRYLKAYSQSEFPDIEIREYSIKEPILNILSDIYSEKPDVVGVSCYIWNIEQTISLIKLLKKMMPDLIIVAGGPEVSFDLPVWFKKIKEIDYIVYGEGELSFHHLLKAIEQGYGFEDVSGIAYLDNGRPVINSPRQKADLNLLPSPYNDPSDIEYLKDKVVYFEASRGCPFSCAYCLSSVETGVRFFPLERVKADLLKLINSGIKTIKFVDRTFNINKKFALEIFRFLIENHEETIFQFEITADIMHPEVLNYLIDNAPKGIFRFEIGVQSTNEITNYLINRRQNFSRLKETVLKLKEGGKIAQHLDLIAGLPEEDYQSFKKTFDDVFALKPGELQLGFLKILRGTSIWESTEKYGYIYMDQAPYEILQNNVLSFADVIRLKRLEDILEKYWNAHRMDRTVEYLATREFETPFDFFQDFGEYWASNGWDRIGHQLESLFARLYDFLLSRKTANIDFILSLMELDYFLNHKYKPRKTWWEFKLTKQEQNQIFKELVEKPDEVSDDFSLLNLDEKRIHKHIMIDIIPFDIETYLTVGKINKQKTLLILYYNPPNQPKYYFKKLE